MRVHTKVTSEIESGRILESLSYDYCGLVVQMRGEQQAQLGLESERLAQQKKFADVSAGRGTQAFGLLMPQLQDMLKSGYSPEEKAAITGESMGALGSAFDALNQNIEQRAARTRNAAGVLSAQDELARERMRQASGLARKNQIDFANEQQRRREAAQKELGGLYGIDQQTLAALMGHTPSGPSGGGGGFRFSLGPFSFG